MQEQTFSDQGLGFLFLFFFPKIPPHDKKLNECVFLTTLIMSQLESHQLVYDKQLQWV